MIKRLKRKFILIATISVAVVLLIIAAIINITNYFQIVSKSDNLISIISDNGGIFPQLPFDKMPMGGKHDISPEAPFSTRFFSVFTDKSGDCIAVDTGKISAATTKDAITYAKDVINSGKTSGFYNKYRYSVAEKDYGSLIIFLDCSNDLKSFSLLLRSSIIIYFFGVIGVFILVILLSGKAIAPVAESYAKQKKFITDASHELKTPLSVISANTEVIEMENGESEWTKSIRNQISRLSSLVNSLVSLTRMDEHSDALVKTDFSLSDAVAETAGPCFILAKSNNKSLVTDIEDNISFNGEEKSIRQLVSILLDNAIKYATENSEIKLSLKKKGKKIILSTENKADNLKKGNYNMIFERFYRLDSSRNSSTGGSGIGLSIAKAIVENHKGKITADCSDGKTITICAIF